MTLERSEGLRMTGERLPASYPVIFHTQNVIFIVVRSNKLDYNGVVLKRSSRARTDLLLPTGIVIVYKEIVNE